MAEKPEYFGEQFEIKDTKTLDVINPTDKVPEYVRDVWGIRALLREAAAKEGWGEMPESVSGVEQFLEAAKGQVTEVWNRAVRPELDKKLAAWADELEAKEADPSVVRLLRSPDLFEEKLSIAQFGVLESIHGTLPDVWQELVLLSSDRQLAAIEVARRWFREIPPTNREQTVRNMGFERAEEVEVFLEIAGFMGKFIDHAYVKQLELAAMPGGKQKTVGSELVTEAEKNGLKYVYDPYDKDKDAMQLLSYAEVFPQEIQNLGKRFLRVRDKVQTLLNEGRLPQSYAELPGYLETLATVYTSAETEPATVYAGWQQTLAMSMRLAKEGCPIMLIPQANASVAGDANKIDIELRLGLQTKETRALQSKIGPFVEIANEYLASITPTLEKPYSVPPIVVNYQPFAFGPNVYWRTRGESNEEQIVVHGNAVADVANTQAKVAFETVFVEGIEDKAYVNATLLSTVLHEVSHVFAYTGDKEVIARVGDNPVMEELKADAGDMKLIRQALEAGIEQIDPRQQMIAKLADVCDYLKNKAPEPGTSGEKYFLDGAAILKRLLDTGVVVDNGRHLNITDYRKGVDEIANLADEVLTLYTTGSAREAESYTDRLRALRSDPAIVSIVERLKNTK